MQSGRHKASGWWGWLVNGTTLGKKNIAFYIPWQMQGSSFTFWHCKRRREKRVNIEVDLLDNGRKFNASGNFI